jgi:hypothetical protein
MCLYVKDQIEPLIADRDIKCWKVVYFLSSYNYNTYVTCYRDKPVLFNTLIKDNNFQERKVGTSIDIGLHTIKTRKEARKLASYYEKHIVIKATIPKGSRYWKGYYCECECYCSDAIIYSEPNSKNN